MRRLIDWTRFLLAPPRCLHCQVPLQRTLLFCKECGEWLSLADTPSLPDWLLVVFDLEGPGGSLTTSLSSQSAYEHLASWMALKWLQEPTRHADYVWAPFHKDEPLCAPFVRDLGYYKGVPQQEGGQTLLLLISHLHDLNGLIHCLRHLSHPNLKKIWILTGTIHSKIWSERLLLIEIRNLVLNSSL
ncbi:hypothetical protein [Candidatus Similichlamydia laticola]|uniref:hypothetical protein n=1 Tax=Candidatus Similichlamydia laticola TaxID=2170265 RepID=UPI000DF81C63|nr:hypothetical protein [Candidatus Similichlamydia laticola]